MTSKYVIFLIFVLLKFLQFDQCESINSVNHDFRQSAPSDLLQEPQCKSKKSSFLQKRSSAHRLRNSHYLAKIAMSSIEYDGKSKGPEAMMDGNIETYTMTERFMHRPEFIAIKFKSEVYIDTLYAHPPKPKKANFKTCYENKTSIFVRKVFSWYVWDYQDMLFDFRYRLEVGNSFTNVTFVKSEDDIKDIYRSLWSDRKNCYLAWPINRKVSVLRFLTSGNQHLLIGELAFGPKSTVYKLEEHDTSEQEWKKGGAVLNLKVYPNGMVTWKSVREHLTDNIHRYELRIYSTHKKCHFEEFKLLSAEDGFYPRSSVVSHQIAYKLNPCVKPWAGSYSTKQWITHDNLAYILKGREDICNRGRVEVCIYVITVFGYEITHCDSKVLTCKADRLKHMNVVMRDAKVAQGSLFPGHSSSFAMDKDPGTYAQTAVKGRAKGWWMIRFDKQPLIIYYNFFISAFRPNEVDGGCYTMKIVVAYGNNLTHMRERHPQAKHLVKCFFELGALEQMAYFLIYSNDHPMTISDINFIGINDMNVSHSYPLQQRLAQVEVTASKEAIDIAYVPPLPDSEGDEEIIRVSYDFIDTKKNCSFQRLIFPCKDCRYTSDKSDRAEKENLQSVDFCDANRVRVWERSMLTAFSQDWNMEFTLNSTVINEPCKFMLGVVEAKLCIDIIGTFGREADACTKPFTVKC